MRRASKFYPVSALAALLVTHLAVLAFLFSSSAARAADPIYPLASVVGLVPPDGMVVSKTFPGFEDISNDAAILIAVQSPAVYEDLKKTLEPDELKKQGITFEKREDLPLSFGTGILVTGKADDGKKVYNKWLVLAPAKNVTVVINAQVPENSIYTDAAVRAALATLTVRETVPDSEKLSLLPFTVGDLAGFHVQNVLAGRALLLGDSTDPVDQQNLKTRLFIGAFTGGPAEPADRAEFARVAFGNILGIEDVRLSYSEPLRIDNLPGFQTVAQAKDAHTGADIMVAQWLRFAGGSFLQMIGMATTDAWPDAQTRMRAVRDSIDLK